MLPYLNWAIWALVIPLSVAERPPVKWEDLMIATSRFPRFFGEVTTINRTGEPKVNGAAQTDGTNGDYVRHASTEYMLYTGEFDHGSQEPSCTHFQARDTAEYAALEQPFWDALYPAKEYKLVYTVQDGGLYLTWRLTFNLKDKVGDDFVVWVDARNCTQIVAAAPAEMGLYVRTREDWYDRHAKLFKDRGITIGS